MPNDRPAPPTDTTISQQVGDTLYIYATNLKLEQRILPYSLPPAGGKVPLAESHIHIQADTATLTGPLVNRGKNISIVARRIIFEHGASIDVSGPDPKMDFVPGDRPQQQDTSPGAEGTKGKDASDGLPAGNITLVAERIERGSTAGATELLRLIAAGGRGGRGQDGQQGQQGKVGDHAPAFNLPQSNVPPLYGPPPSPPYAKTKEGRQKWAVETQYSNPSLFGQWFGRNGGAGGRGGAGGQSGRGGRGGNVVVLAEKAVSAQNPDVKSGGGSGLLPLPPALLNIVVQGGEASTSKGGPGGTGGSGGLGTKVYGRYYERGSALHFQDPGMTPNGQQGPTGPAGADRTGTVGEAGTMEVEGNRSYEQLAKYVDLSLLLMTQRLAKFAYLNAGAPVGGNAATRDYKSPCELFQWLAKITEPAERIGLTEEVLNVWRAVHASAKVELTRFSQGLDYFGHSTTWVPTLTLKLLTGELDAVLPLAKIIEADYDAFNKKGAEAIDRSNAYTKARGSLEEALGQLNSSSGTLHETIDASFKAIQSEGQAIGLQQQHLLDLQDDFTKAWTKYVAEHTPGCSFSDVLEAMKAIVALGEAAYTGVGDVTAAFKAVGTVVSDLSKFKGAIEKIQKVVGDVDKIGKAWQNVRTAITPDSPDAAKLVITEEDFDNTIEPYLSQIPTEAKALQDAVHHYFDLIQSRNTLLLNYNALYIKKLDLESQVAQQQAQLARLETSFQAENLKDVNLPEYTVFMEQAYNAVRDYIVWLLYQETRAYEYWLLKEKPLALSDLRISFLADRHLERKKDILEAMSAVMEPENEFEEQTIVVDLQEGTSAHSQLQQTKKLTIRADPGAHAFRNFWDVRATEVEIALPQVDAPKDAELTVRLLHNGNSVIVDSNGLRRVFTHEPRIVGFVYKNHKITGHANLGNESAGYANLSPFTTWTLDFGLSGNEWLDYSKIQSLELRFRGYWRMNPPLAKRVLVQTVQSDSEERPAVETP